MIEVKVTHQVEEQRVQDLLCCALEGGSNYWYSCIIPRYPEGQTKQSLAIVFEHLELPFKSGSLLIESGEGGPGDRVLDIDAVKRGLQLLADNYPKHWSDFMQDNEDSDTGDAFLQLALFGEIVFG